MKKNRKELIDYINGLKAYEGYVQFSHRPIDKTKDIFYENKKVKILDESGFVSEAHFYNGTDSITIKQINESWYVDENKNVPITDTQTYLTDIEGFNYKVKMAQMWVEEPDEYCEGMDVLKLRKVVFAGFKKGESK